MKRFFQYLVYLAALGFMKLMERLPRRMFRGLAWLFSWIAMPFPQLGGLVRMNIRCAFPEKGKKEVFDLSRRCIASLILTVCEFFWFHNKPEKIREMVDIQPNLARVAETAVKCLKEGRPVIFITPHHGNWEFSGMVLGIVFGFKMATVVRTPRNPYLGRLITGGRSVQNVQIIESRGGMMKLVHAMENGRAAGMLVDQNVKIRNGGAFVDMFGLPCPVTRFPGTMVLRKNAYIGVGSCIRMPDGHFKATMDPLPKPSSEYASEEEVIRDIMKMTEDLIRMAPEQYLWLYKRFQHIPQEASEELKAKYPPYAQVVRSSFFSRVQSARKKPDGE